MNAIDSTAEEIGQELVHVPMPAPTTLFRTEDPSEVLERATKVANVLKGVITQQQLAKRINNRDHVLVEAWTTLASMLGVSGVLVWSRRIEPMTEYPVEVIHYEYVTDNGRRVKREKGRSNYVVKGWDWEARVEVHTPDGRVIGAAEAMCSRGEHTWATREDFALRSMASTRAMSKALRGPLGFVVVLAGYNPTPAEEMGEPDEPTAQAPPPRQQAPPAPVAASPPVVDHGPPATDEQRAQILELGKAVDPLVLLNVVRIEIGNRPVDMIASAAQEAAERIVARLPAKHVAGIVTALTAAAKENA